MRLFARLLLPVLACACLLTSDPARSLDPARSIAQYKHTSWTTEDGAPPNFAALAQGRDGYLWIGSLDGLYRFDGVMFENIPPERRIGDRATVSALLATRDGTIWAGYGVGGVARFRGGVLTDAGMPHPDAYVMSLVQTGDGAVWASLGRLEQPLARYANGRWEEIGANWGLPRDYLINIKAARDGTLWVTTLTSVVFLKPGSRRFERSSEVPVGHAALSEDPAGRIWLSDDSGSRAITGVAGGSRGGRVMYPTPGSPRAVRTFFDRDGNLWGMAGRTGIFRLRSPEPAGAPSKAAAAAQIDLFPRRDGLTANNVASMMEDREGNIWVGTALGLDRFRAANIVTEPKLIHPPAYGTSLLGASDGAVYIGEADTVYRVAPGGNPEPVLDRTGEVESLCEGPDGSIWVALSNRIVRLRGGKAVTLPRPATLPGQGVSDCAVDRHNVPWLTASDSGAFRLDNGRWQSLMVPPPGSPDGPTTAITDRRGRLLVSLTENTIGVIEHPRLTTFIPNRPGALRYLRTMYETPQGVLLGGRFGLGRWQGRRVQIINTDRVPAFNDPTGVVQTPGGETWLIGKRGIVRVSTAALNRAFDDPRFQLQPTVLDFRDGLPGNYNREGKREVVRGGDGRLWFATAAGVVWVDPAHLTRNTQAPRVAINAVVVNGRRTRDPATMTLPRGVSRIEIDYAALSLSIPERIRVRYRLEGLDNMWMDPGMRRQAFYTNLAPGTYRFSVIAANNDGVWNREGATFEFTVQPTFFQSTWFLLLCAIGVGMLLWLAYSLRVRQVTARLKSQLEVRLAERERIARELHDTLLQGFQGLVLRFQSIADRIPPDQPLRPLIDQALDRADAVLIEGRDRVRDLRTEGSGDLAQALIDAASELNAVRPARFSLTIEGRQRDLHPMVSEELQRIGEEAIRNAFQHGQATAIEVVLTYRRSQMELSIRDDGVGLPEDVALAGERAGHFGLIGMRERAARIGGLLTIDSRTGSGTQIRLSIPGRSAYASRARRWRLPFLPAPKHDES